MTREHGYDAEAVASTFDRYGDLEWSRHEQSPHARVAFHIHRELLRRHIRPGDRVLEAGAGAGRFTVELTGLGAMVTVVDISPEQLELNRRHLSDMGMEPSVEARERVDIVDLGRFADGSFDAVVCFGGPLSYVMERRDQAFAELLRVTKPSGVVLASVMSLLGTARLYLPAVVSDVRTLGARALDFLTTGDLPGDQSSTAPTHLFTWREVETMVARQPCDLIDASAANFLTTGHDDFLERVIADDPATWDSILEWEAVTVRRPGALDGGTHIVFAVRAPAPPGATPPASGASG